MSERLYSEMFKPRAVISIQARMASKRLPGKVLKIVRGKSLLSWQIGRLKLSATTVVVATTFDFEDEAIGRASFAAGSIAYAGSGTDVPKRHLTVASQRNADYLGFCGADQTLVSAEHFDLAFQRLSQGDCDYVRVVGLPHGLHVWAVTRKALEACVADQGRTPDEIEHTGAYWDARPDLFRTVDLDMGKSREYRLTVDTPEDLEVHRLIIEALPDPVTASVDEIIALMDAHPEWAAINANVSQYYWQGAANRPGVHA